MITSAWLGLQDRVGRGVREVGHRARADPVHPRGADAVLRSAQRHRAGLSARRPRGRSHVDDLIASFEEAYAKMYASSARSPEFGYLVTHVIVHGTVDVEKPALPAVPEEPGTPPLKATRPVHWGRASEGEYVETDIFQLEEIRAGQLDRGPGDRRALGHDVRRATGPQRVASTATTSSISPTARRASDGHRRLHAHRSSRPAPIGWEGRTLLSMLAESERLFAQTGPLRGPTRAGDDAHRIRSATRSCSRGCAEASSRRARPR